MTSLDNETAMNAILEFVSRASLTHSTYGEFRADKIPLVVIGNTTINGVVQVGPVRFMLEISSRGETFTREDVTEMMLSAMRGVGCDV